MAASEFSRLAEAGQHRAALNQFQRLPLEWQRQKTLLKRRVHAACEVSDEEYLAALRFWRVQYPQDPAIDLLAIDGFLIQKNFDEALAAVNRLDAFVGGDAYLDYLRALVHRKAGHAELADAARDRAAAADKK